MGSKSLRGRKVLITRPLEGAEDFKRKLDFEEAEVINLPMIQLCLVEEVGEIKNALDRLEEFEWIVFNSPAAVRFFFQLTDRFQLKLYFYPDLKFATVGEKTKMTLEQLGYRTNFVPIQYTAEVLAENLPDIEEKRILIPSSALSSGNYVEVLSKRGALPELIHLYENRAVAYSDQTLAELKSRKIDFLTFTSGSTLENFCKSVGMPQLVFPSAKVICIGPSTAQRAQDLGVRVDGIAQPHTVEGMIEKMKEIAIKNIQVP